MSLKSFQRYLEPFMLFIGIIFMTSYTHATIINNEIDLYQNPQINHHVLFNIDQCQTLITYFNIQAEHYPILSDLIAYSPYLQNNYIHLADSNDIEIGEAEYMCLMIRSGIQDIIKQGELHDENFEKVESFMQQLTPYYNHYQKQVHTDNGLSLSKLTLN